MGETSVTAASSTGSRSGEGAGHQDGRLTRAARTRAAVVDALLTLNDRGNVRPTARDIATEAGVSLRSLYVHFDDLEALFVAASDRHAERMAAKLPPPVTEGPLEVRLEAFLARRAILHEEGAGVRRAALLQEPFSPTLRQALSNGRRILRADVRNAFAPEIDQLPEAEGARLWRALEIATSASAWETLRLHQGLPVDETVAQVRAMILAFLDTWRPADAAPTGMVRARTISAGPPA